MHTHGTILSTVLNRQKSYSMSSEFQHFRQRKMEELRFLRNWAGLSTVDAPQGSDFYHFLLSEKQYLRATLISQTLFEHTDRTETNSANGTSFWVSDWHLQSSYQRFDLQTLIADPIAQLYDLDSRDLRSVALLVSSGMGAITALLLGLRAAVNGPVNINALPSCYFETIQVIRQFFPTVRLYWNEWEWTCGFNVLWYDSICPESFACIREQVNTRFVDLLVIDTTCYDIADERIADCLDFAVAHGVPCALVRSHTKLDSLAMEYGRLGSITIAFRADLSSNVISWLRGMATATKNAISRFGLQFHIENLFPAYFDDTFRALNARRIGYIRSNTQLLSDRLTNEQADMGCEVALYHHGLFLTVRPPRSLSRSELELKRSELIDELTKERLPVRSAGSFGFDFTAIDLYRDLLTGADLLRISPSDLPGDVIPVLADQIVSFIKRL